MIGKTLFSILFVLLSFASQAKPLAWAPAPPFVNCSLEDRDGNLWFGSDEGVFRYNPSRKKRGFVKISPGKDIDDNKVISILEDQYGTIWAGTKSGLFRYKTETDSTVAGFYEVPILISKSTYSQDSKEKEEVQREIWCMARDKTGKIWLGTDEGAFYFQPGASTSESESVFTYFLHYDYTDNPFGLNLNAVTSILDDGNGNIWFTTWFEGICRYDGKTVINYKPEEKLWFATVFKDKSGNLWFGSRDHGVYRYTPSAEPVRSESFENAFPDVNVLNASCVPVITQDKDGNMWFGTEHGDLSQRETLGGVWCDFKSGPMSYRKELFSNFTFKDGLPGNSVFDLLVDKSGTIWIGTRNGLCSLKTRSVGKAKQHFKKIDLPH